MAEFAEFSEFAELGAFDWSAGALACHAPLGADHCGESGESSVREADVMFAAPGGAEGGTRVAAQIVIPEPRSGGTGRLGGCDVKHAGYNVLRILALTVLLFILFAVAGSLIAAPADADQANQGAAALLLLVACFLDALVLTYIIRRAVTNGWRLVVGVFVAFFGIMTFMSQIESAVFPTQMSSEMVWRVFAMGLLITAPFSLIAVPVLGRWSKPASDANEFRGEFGASGWIWRLSVMACVYVAVYFLFGYFVAWQFPAVREYYGGGDLQGFVTHFRDIIANSSWLIAFQFLRGLIWAMLGWVIAKIVGKRKFETSLAVGLAFCVLMNAQLLLPNPFMPEAVRMAHLLETASSNFLFGLFVGWVLLSGVSARDQEAAL